MRLFPRLAGDPAFRKTSDETWDYNCIAFAAGDSGRWWWPPQPSGVTSSASYWPPWAPSEESVAAFVAVFQGLGYVTCPDESFRRGFEKIAIYASPTGAPTHAALQLEDGTWKSKLGPFIDVGHSDPNGVAGHRYGSPVVVMERRITAPRLSERLQMFALRSLPTLRSIRRKVIQVLRRA